MLEFIEEYKKLEQVAMDYLKEILDAQEKAPKYFYNGIISEANGIEVESIQIDEDRVYAHYCIDEWDCNGTWQLDITDRRGVESKLQILADRIATWEKHRKELRMQNEEKEKQELARLSAKYNN